MASVTLSSRNGNGPRSTDFISNFTNNRSRLNFTRLHNVPNHNHSHFTRLHNSVPANSNGYRYISYRLSSYTKRELKQLRKRLMSDLERVRILRQWICSTPTPMTEVTVGQKRSTPLPPRPVRDTKKRCGRVNKSKLVMRKCGQILGKLMQHKHGWVFNTPLDVQSLNIYDYHKIITNPMDLGTIKLKLVKNEYESPLAFASDVRLTFENAMLYNGKGSDVFIMATRLLLLFEDLFNSSHETFYGSQVKKQKVAKDIVNLVVKKPVMTADEKTELRSRLSNLQLGDEGVDQIMAIVKKGVGLEQQGEDEIELDLAVIDNDALWELHSFIGRQTNSDMNGVMVSSVPNSGASEAVVNEECRKSDDGEEEDIDIGEEMQLTDFPCIEIEKDAVNVSSRGSSSSDSGSSSSDSSSGSFSGNSYNQQNSTPKGNGSRC